MKRTPILLALLMALAAACGGTEASPSATESDNDPTATAEERTTEPTEEPAATADAGDETALDELVPDELNGVARTDLPGMDQFFASALQAQGLDAEGAEFVVAVYGEQQSGVALTAFRLPSLSDTQMEALARTMAGGQMLEGVESEAVTVGGKDVLRLSVGEGGEEAVVYLYFAQGAAFSIVSQDAELAEQLLAELP